MKNKPMRISARLTDRQRENIEQKVAAGKYRNISDFIRVSIEKEAAA